jgi:hypothetical protein
VYKRNIKVFSSEYSNGILSIGYSDNDRASNTNADEGLEDLMLAYHGNDHYNSVVRLNNKQSTPFPPSSKDKTKSVSVNNPDNTNNSKDGLMNNRDQDTSSHSIRTGNESRRASRPPTRGSLCPCGSGLKYKKCCFAQEKAKKRTAKFVSENHHNAEEGGNSNHKKKNDDTDEDYIGSFRVISI